MHNNTFEYHHQKARTNKINSLFPMTRLIQTWEPQNIIFIIDLEKKNKQRDKFWFADTLAIKDCGHQAPGH